MIGQNSQNEAVTIRRNEDYSPVVYDGLIANGCVFEKSLLGIFGTLIIDQEFINEMHKEANKIKDNYEKLGLLDALTEINNDIVSYFYNGNKKGNKKDAFSSVLTITKEGFTFGTTLSSLKGKNVAECSERSIATYLVLQRLHEDDVINHSPTLVVSYLNDAPHAFLLLDKKGKNNAIKHLLWDTNNLLEMQNKETKEKIVTLGMFTLSEEERENIVKGTKCSPTPTFTVLDESWIDLGEQRTYGNALKVKINK